MKNLPYEQNLRQKKEMLQNYQKEMTDMRDRKTQEKQKRIAEERQYVNQINQKLEEEKIRTQNLKAIRVNEKMQEYQQFIIKKQEEKSNKFRNKQPVNEEPLFEKEKHKYLNNMNHNINTNATHNQTTPNQLPNNPYLNNAHYQNPTENEPRNYTPTNLNEIHNYHPESNKLPNHVNPNLNKELPNYSQLKHVNEYSPYEMNAPQYNALDHPSENNKEKVEPSLMNNNTENKNQGLYAGYEDLKGLDFSDPNFDYNKYDELMQKYARDYLNKEDERKTLGKDEDTGKVVNDDLYKHMEKLNINQNNPLPYDRENPYQNHEHIHHSGNPNDLYPSKQNHIPDYQHTHPYITHNPQYEKHHDQNFSINQPNHQNVMRNEYSNVTPTNKGSTPQQNIRNIPNSHQNYEEQYNKHQVNNYSHYNEPNTIHNIPNNVHTESNPNSHDKNRPRSSSQNPYGNANNQANPTHPYDPSRMINIYQYNQMNYLKNKSNNQVSNITNSNYNFERITPEQRNMNAIQNNYNTANVGNNYQNQIPSSSNVNTSDFNNILRNKKYEQQLLYKNFLDSQVKEKTYLKDNYKVNEFISLNKKEKNLQINPYTSKNYDFNYTNLNSNIITPLVDSRSIHHNPQPNYYQERPVVINNNPNNYQDHSNNSQPSYNNNNSYNRPSSGKLQMVGNNIMR